MDYTDYENERYLDVVDVDDQIIDTATRDEIHRRGLLHREIHVWMFDEQYNIFFQKRSLHRPSAGLLDASVGGHVNSGEEYLHAATRETVEETGLNPAPHELVFLKKFKVSSLTPAGPEATVNNFVRAVYIYKHPVKEEALKKESGLPGTEFKKFSPDFLVNATEEEKKLFDKFILEEELPHVLDYLENL